MGTFKESRLYLAFLDNQGHFTKITTWHEIFIFSKKHEHCFLRTKVKIGLLLL